MVNVEDLVEGNKYRVIANVSFHEFGIGEVVRFGGFDIDNDIICEKLDKSDYWYMEPEELEEV